eukprot:1149764-Pelagomonas_calceolata.AAC.5
MPIASWHIGQASTAVLIGSWHRSNNNCCAHWLMASAQDQLPCPPAHGIGQISIALPIGSWHIGQASTAVLIGSWH